MSPGLPVCLPGGSCTTALVFIWSLGERREQIFSIRAAGTEGGFGVSKWEQTILKHCPPWCCSSPLWCCRPRSVLASGISEGSCPGTQGLVPPSCSLLWHPCALAKQSPISKQMLQFQTDRPCQAVWVNHKEIIVSEASFGPSLRGLSDPFMAAARLASSLLVGGHLQSCERLSTRDPAWASLVRSPGAGSSFVHCWFRLIGHCLGFNLVPALHPFPVTVSLREAFLSTCSFLTSLCKNPRDCSSLRGVVRDTICLNRQSWLFWIHVVGE